MITKQNFKDLLKHLDFSENNHIFSKNIDGSELKVDFDNEKLARDLCKIPPPLRQPKPKHRFSVVFISNIH